MTAPYAFNANEIWTLGIAAYAAVVSTFILGWDAYMWLAAGPKLEISIQTGMKVYGGVVEDPNTYITVTVWNVGDQPTTITNLGGMQFDSWWQAYVRRKRPVEAFIVTQPSQDQRIPYRFDVGDQWIGMAEQTEEILEQARSGYLFLTVYTARGGRGIRARVKVKEKNASNG